MKRFFIFILLIAHSIVGISATITWDGGGGDGLWATATNWVGNVLPGATDDVVLDNSSLAGSYTVTLPNATVVINSLTITPSGANTITATIPTTSSVSPGLQTNASIYINNNGTLKNSSTAAAVPTIIIGSASTDSMYIHNGGTYEHNTQRSISSNTPNSILEKTSTAVGTEYGRTHFNVPQTGSAALSLQGRTFGTLEFSAGSAPSALTYTSSGTAGTDLKVRGNFSINTPANFSTTIIGNITVAGNFTNTGNFTFSPSTAGGSIRSLLFNGSSNQIVSGTGTITFGTDFRNVEVSSGSTVTLQRSINMTNASNTFIINNNGTLQMAANVINGTGSFQLLSGGWLGMGSPGGIATAPAATGNVQTSTRTFAADASYEYNGAIGVTQVTGTALPPTISGKLKINTQAGLGTTGVTLTQGTTVNGEFILTDGKLTTAMPNILYIGSSAITTAGYVDNSFVNGAMSKYGNTVYKFPVGKGVDIHPVQLETTNGDVADLYTVEYFKANPASFCTPGTFEIGIDHISKLEYWAIQCISTATPVNQITLHATGYTYATDRSRLVITDCTSGSWVNLGNADISMAGAVGPVTSFLPVVGGFFNFFTFASLDPSPVNPLPIDLISFNANKLSNTTSSINWELSACCSSAAKFEIQRAGTNKAFVTIATIGGSETNKLYDYIDNGIKNGVNYYRLKMIDADGKISYSRIVAVMNGVNGLLLTSLIPTVTTNQSILTVASSNQNKLGIFIIDMQGRVVMKRNFTIAEGNTSIELSLAGLAAGAYQLAGISIEGKTNTIRFIKQ